MSALREVLAKFGFEVDDTKLTDAIQRTDDFTKKVVDIASKFAGGSILGAVKDMIGDLKDKAGEIRGTAALLGITNAEFQKLQYVSGASAETLGSTFRVLQKNIAAASGAAKEGKATLGDLEAGLATSLGSKEAGEAFKGLGISIKDASGKTKSPIDVFKEAGKAIASIEDPSQRTATALKVFGRNGTQLLPFLAKGPEEIEKLTEQFEALGGGISDKALKQLKEQAKADKALSLATLSLKSALAEQLIPIFTEQSENMAKLVGWINKTLEGTNLLKAGVIIIGGAMAWQGRQALLAGAKTALAYAPVIITVAALILLLDDLITFFQGGDSVLGAFLDKMFDPSKGPSVSKMMQKDMADLGKELDKAPGWGDKVLLVFSTIGGSISRFFTDDLPEAWAFFWKDLNEQAGHKGAGFTDFIKEMFGNLLGWFRNWANDLWTSIIGGLVSGLDEGWSKVKEAVLGLGRKMKNAFSEFWDAHSPSKVMTKDVKVMLGGGIVQGLAESEADIRAQARETYAAARMPSDDYAPNLGDFRGGGGGSSVNYNSIVQHNSIPISVTGDGAQGMADALRDALPQPLNDTRRAALAALESAVDDE